MPAPYIPSSGLAFVDIETTGGPAQCASITEIAVVQVADTGVREWSTLVRPEMRIPRHIELLTGISNDMVASAPRFEDIADDLFDQLDGRLFVAHNARFDHGHIKAAFRRMGVSIRPRVLCTVKLSRRLFPHERRHSLDHVIGRLKLDAGDRHRALSDARVLWQFWQKLPMHVPVWQVEEVVKELSGRPALPPFLDPLHVDALPDAPGVYLFYGDNDILLYVGKSTRIRTRVLSHFSADHASDRELSLSQQVRRIEYRRTEGELGALLEEARLIKALHPTHNRQLRRNRDLCAWRLEPDLLGDSVLRLVNAADLNASSISGEAGASPHLAEPAHDLGSAAPEYRPPEPGQMPAAATYGFFRSRRSAMEHLRSLCAENRLCPPLLGLEKRTPGRCFNHQLKRCEGACLGKESSQAHAARVATALDAFRVQMWSYGGPVCIREGTDFHVVNNWCYFGRVRHLDQAVQLLVGARPTFDLDIYKILTRMMQTYEVLNLPEASASLRGAPEPRG